MLLALAALAGGPAVSAQQPQQPPVFRSAVQVVEVDARVFDSQGRFVADLTKDDFEIIENGAPQVVRTLYLVGQPGPAPGVAGAVDPGVASGAAAPARPSAGQAWIFVFDLAHLTPGGGFERARQAVEAFISGRFREGDLAGVVAGDRMVNNRLTSVRAELVEAVKSVKPRGDMRARMIELTREWPRMRDESEAIRIAENNRDAMQAAVTRACSDDPDACRVVPPDAAVLQKATRLRGDMQRATQQTLTAINGLASGLAKMPGPKTIVFLSEGFVAQQLEASLRTVVGQVARAGARVYGIDVRGLNRGGNPGIIDQMVADDPAGAAGRFDGLEDGPNSLAVDTGGLMIRNENNIGRALDTVARDAGQYYVLGFESSNTAWDGTFRSLDVKVKRPNVRVRARRGYLALEPARLLRPQPVKPPDQPSTAPPGSAAVPGLRAPGDESGITSADPRTDPRTDAAASEAPIAPPGSAPRHDAVRVRPDASARVRELAGDTTDTGGALAVRGWEAYQRGDIEAAIGPLTAAAAEPSARPWVLYVLGLTQAALGRRREATESWERVRQLAPDFTQVYIDLAAHYAATADLTKGLAVLREAERRWPADTAVHNGIGVIHVRRGALDEAIEAFLRAARAEPGEALTHLNLGRAYELKYARSRRYVTSQRRWTSDEPLRRQAIESYARCVGLGGPYATAAGEALRRLEWGK